MKNFSLSIFATLFILLVGFSSIYAQRGTGNYSVVINHEEQYSIWPDGQPLPRGYKYTGKKGSLEDCTSHIKQVWTDMRPLSLRKQMEDQQDKE